VLAIAARVHRVALHTIPLTFPDDVHLSEFELASTPGEMSSCQFPVYFRIAATRVVFHDCYFTADILDVPDTVSLSFNNCSPVIFDNDHQRPLALANAHHLKHLAVDSRSSPTLIDPSSISKCVGLQSLNLGELDLADEYFEDLSQLQSLTLWATELFRGSSLGHVTQLRTLQIHSCQQFCGQYLRLCPQLTSLDLCLCPAVFDVDFIPMTHLVALKLRSMVRLTDAALAPLANLQNLQVEFCRKIAMSAVHFDHLHTLYINGHSDVSADSFQHVNGVKMLRLRYSAVADTALANIARNGQLRTVDLHYVQHISAEGFNCLRGVKNLAVKACFAFTDASLSCLSSLERLEVVQPNDEFTGSGFAHLPNVSAVHLWMPNSNTQFNPVNLSLLPSLDLLWVHSMPPSCILNVKSVRSLVLEYSEWHDPVTPMLLLLLAQKGLRCLEVRAGTGTSKDMTAPLIALAADLSLHAIHSFYVSRASSFCVNLDIVRRELRQKAPGVLWRRIVPASVGGEHSGKTSLRYLWELSETVV
jgi:hypothetical protein